MEIEEYVKGKDTLEEKEKYISRIIDMLDKESFELFKEIIDLSDESVYKIIPLYERANYLTDVYSKVMDAISYVNKIEASNFEYAFKRYQLKKLLISMTTISSFLLNALLGIFLFVILSKKANKDFADECDEIYNAIDTIDDEKLRVIFTTLGNCSRLLKGKEDRVFKRLKEMQTDESLCIMICNDAINSYISGEVNAQQLLCLEPNYQSTIVNILKQDLNTDSEDLIELLTLAKEKSSKNTMLLLENKND